jgi:hypothetical protein
MDDLRHLASRGAKPVEESLLVLQTAPGNDVNLGIVAHRSLHEARSRRAIEVSEVLAGQKAH